MGKRKTGEILRQGTATWNPNAGGSAPAPEWNPNSSPEYWSIANLDGSNEVSLHQWGWSVTTVGGSRYDLPPRRGSDITTAYKPGQLHRRKVPDARPITLMMFMVGFNPGTGQAPPDQRLQWNDNWDDLRRLVYRNHLLGDQRFRLIRRHFVTAKYRGNDGRTTWPTTRGAQPDGSTYDGCVPGDPGVPTPGPRLLTAFGVAEMTGTMSPSMTGRFRSDFQLDFTMSDPFFYGDHVATSIEQGTPAYLWNDGHDVVSTGYVQVDFVGPLLRPRLTNHSTGPDSYVEYNGYIGPGEYLRLAINKYSAEMVYADGRPNANKIGLIRNYGSRWWFNLLPGSNRIALTGTPMANLPGGYGHVNVAYRHPYV